MAIDDNKRDLVAGTRLVATYKKQTYVCTVQEGEEGKLEYVLEDGKRFKSPSAAGSAVMGGSACNGWRFWTIEGEAPTVAQGPKPEREAGHAGGAKGKKLIYRIPNQTGVAEGQTKFFCRACMKGFLVETGSTPEVCPEGHRTNDAELTAPAGVEAQA